MTNFDHLRRIMLTLDTLEGDLQGLRDYVDLKAKPSINQALQGARSLRDSLWGVDKALEEEAAPSLASCWRKT